MLLGNAGLPSNLQISLAIVCEEMREATFHFEATPQTLLQLPAMTFRCPTLPSNTSPENNLSTGLGTECAVSKSFYISFVLALVS